MLKPDKSTGLYRFDPDREPEDRGIELRDVIQRIALEFPYYGRPRIVAELRRRGWDVGHRRVGRILREDNLLCLRKRKFVVATTDSSHRFRVYPNLAREMTLGGIDQLWVADITYIRLEVEFVYLAVILDDYSRRVIGWALGRSLEDDLAIAALNMAFDRRGHPAGLTHHSDRGVQYASNDYTDLLIANGVRISMSRKGNPYDKAYAPYCTSCEPWTMFAGKRRRSASLKPCALRGGSGPGSSYRHMFLSFTGYALSKPFAPHARTHSCESFKRSAISSIVSKPFSRSRS
jgi:transposase InsO family protein